MPSSMQGYKVTINNNITTAAPGDGFIDPVTIQRYYSYNPYNATNYYSQNATPYAFETTPSGLTLGLTQAKRRANYRWHEMLRQLELVTNVWIDPNSIAVTGGSAPGWTPTAVSFVMVAPYGDPGWMTPDETTPGTVLYGTSAITRCIARALVCDQFSGTDIFDPTSSGSVPSTATSVPRFGTRIDPRASFEIGPYAGSLAAAAGCIAVTKTS